MSARRGVVRQAVVAALGLALLALLLAPTAGEGSSPFNVNGRVSKLTVLYSGPCQPGNLETSIPASGGMPLTIDVSGSVEDCISTAGFPSALLIEDELFGYGNVAVKTTQDVSASAGVTVTVQDLAGQGDFVANFPESGQLYIGQEKVSYTKTPTGFTLTARGLEGTAAVSHSPGTLIRLEGKLNLVRRGQARYVGGDSSSLTQEAAHSGTAAIVIGSPKTYLTCRGRTDQTKTSGGSDPVSGRTRCYGALEPGANPPAAFWPDPYTGPLVGLTPAIYHDLSSGTVNRNAGGSTTPMTLTTGYLGVECFPYIENLLWVAVTTTVTLDKTPLNTEFGQFRVKIYPNAGCTGTPLVTLGEADGNNLVSMEIAASTDSDGDGCSDLKELGPDQSAGGARDPFNPFDFFDVNADKAVDLFNDIFGVAGGFGTSPGHPDYSTALDRGPLLEPTIAWNLSGADGTIDLFGDVFAVAAQFGHGC